MDTHTAFVGLGIMGKPMAKNLLAEGFDLVVSDLNVDAVDEVVKAGAESKSLSEIGAECDVIFTCLPSGRVVQEVLFGDGGISSTIKKEAIVVDHSSVTPEQAKYCGYRLKEIGVHFLDAPVSGGEPKAISGELAIMAGGDDDAFNKVMPYFKAIGSSATRIGDVGSGSVAKLANQIIVNLSIAVVSEAMVFAEKAGADPNLVYRAIRGGLAGSTVLDAKVPLMTSRNFKPGGKISINHKDITNVLSSAHEMDIPVPLTAQLYEILQTLKVMGCMDEDHGAIVKYFEMLADVEIGSNFKS